MIEDLNKKDSIRNSLNSKNITLPYKRNESQCSEGNNNQENMDIEV